jgi:exopolysaccharide production protein ExoY
MEGQVTMATRSDKLSSASVAAPQPTGTVLEAPPPARLFELVSDEPLVARPAPSVLPPARTASWIWQRSLDIAVSLICLALVWPIMAATALLVLISSPGPVIYSHRRLGRDGKVFGCLKFRTMRRDADKILQELLRSSPALMAEWVAERKLRNDPRITSIGQFLRRYSIDELPQLINVLKGDMSIVGPRPLAVDEAHHYEDAYARCCSVNPGITGLWQVSGRNDVSYSRRVALDCQYARARCLRMDLWIIVRTIPVVFGGTGH